MVGFDFIFLYQYFMFYKYQSGLRYYIAHKAIMIRNDEVIIKRWIYFLSGLKVPVCVGAFGSSGFTLILNSSVLKNLDYLESSIS